ncbi:HD-GYP domain-containing protein [bacterium]|nr:HD-GYP domain-containing protein [bacterium]MBU1754469.1 HD-GYP domain-containing protein [bacterium]
MGKRGVFFKGISDVEGKTSADRGATSREIIIEALENIPPMLSDETQKEAMKIIHYTVNNVKMGKVVDDKEVKRLIKNMVEEIIANQDAMLNLIKIKSHDEYTFSHSVNVCMIAILIGVRYQLPIDSLEELAFGAMLQDLGKIMVPDEILFKLGRLNEKELEEIKKHPLYSQQILSENSRIGELPKKIAYQHHERWHGQGYPQRISGENIELLARITAIADVYDALTTDRPYRKKFLPYDAVRLIVSRADDEFYADAVRAFVESVSIYPLGSLVKLNTEEVGMVIKINRKAIVRPTIRILFNPSGNIMEEPINIDLIKDRERFVICAIDEEEVYQMHTDQTGEE